MKVFIDTFKSNNPKLKPEDIVWGFTGAAPKNGVAAISFKTKDKYHHVNSDMSVFGPKGRCEGVTIQPIISEDGEIVDTTSDSYSNHPDWYYLCLCVDMEMDGCVSVCTPLKHEYTITYIDYETAFADNRSKQLTMEEV